MQCRNRCFGWAPCPSPADDSLKFHAHGHEGAYRNNNIVCSPRDLAGHGSTALEPPYLELQGSADDNEIPYEKVFEMEQKKRRLFASSASSSNLGGSGSCGSHLAQVH